MKDVSGPRRSAPTRSPAPPRHLDGVLRRGGRPLAPAVRGPFESAFNYDFSRVRVHSDHRAGETAARLGAMAYTVGTHIVVGPHRAAGDHRATARLLAHELAHIVQQDGADFDPAQRVGVNDDPARETEAERAAVAFEAGQRPIPVRRGHRAPALYAQLEQPYAGRVRSPVVEEVLTQETELVSAGQGLPLTQVEIELARTVFGDSIDYGRVRILRTAEPLWFRTVGNVIRVPPFFTVDPDAPVRPRPLPVDAMRHTFIHELTHVWQYQHGGTSYISYALGPQIAGILTHRGRYPRNAAYCYNPDPTRSFWEFTPEQQGLIVENTFLMRESRRALMCDSHGVLRRETRATEIARLLPIHDRCLAQMRAALPEPEAAIRLQRAGEGLAQPPVDVPLPAERQLAPLKPALEIRF